MTFAAAYAKDRDLKAFVPSATAVTCTFKTLDQLFPRGDTKLNGYDHPIIHEYVIQPNPDEDDGTNYYGGFATYIDIPQANSAGYKYFVTHDDRGTGSNTFLPVSSTATAALYYHVCDVASGGSGCWNEYKTYLQHASRNHQEQWASTTEKIRDQAALDCDNTNGNCGGTNVEIAGSHSINLIEHEPSVQSLIGVNNQPNDNGVITCSSNFINDLQYNTSARDDHAVTTNGIKCELKDFERKWYVGVQNLCTDRNPNKPSDDIFAWYTYQEAPRSISITKADAGDATGDMQVLFNGQDAAHATTDGLREGSGNTPFSPSEILFAAPPVARISSRGAATGAVEEFSSIKEITSGVQFSYTTNADTTLTGQAAAPSRCVVTRTTIEDEAGEAIDDDFNTACKVQATSSMIVDFRDAPSSEQCSLGTKRVAEIEYSIVQFARTHTSLTLPTIKNNTAQQFQDAYTSASWSCLELDNCNKGDPFQVIAHNICRMEAVTVCQTETPAACTKTLDCNIGETALLDPRTLYGTGAEETPITYVMGIADFSISDCGAANFNDPINHGEYLNRRLGASVSKPGVRRTQLHYGSYRGY